MPLCPMNLCYGDYISCATITYVPKEGSSILCKSTYSPDPRDVVSFLRMTYKLYLFYGVKRTNRYSSLSSWLEV